ncbi:MAG: 5-(carboxyamino)imidazole ribonucleotide synthase [Proteobacteria bacterium]|nr:5-(carboxyamino)imidazole ribonucleotide synthase [Pseudomonadota bacterium]TDJ35597.1 MAG: 5-(carboxyamino)imidazole ribonucleotide synthase [Gammaproteobacteria bacterium]
MKRIGIIGAGQLGQMLGFAGQNLDVEFVFLDPSPDPPASVVGPVLRLPFDSDEGLRQLASDADVVTYEFENVSVSAIERVCADTIVYPPLDALRISQDRLSEKQLFESLQIPVPPYRTIDSAQDLRNAANDIGLPLVLKTRRLGYDGKGQAVVRDEADLSDALTALGGSNLIAEQWVPFDCEVSAICVRNVRGDVLVYPLIENQHRDGILIISRAPAEANGLAALATRHLRQMLAHFDYVGVLTIEFFVAGDQLLANEFAPRVHNSGHWTIEGARTSQFENHLRAILDLPLGDVSPVGHAAMLNLIGSMPPKNLDLGSDTIFLHDYGKRPRPGRKLGHITVVASDPADRDRTVTRLSEILVAQANPTGIADCIDLSG